MIPAARTIGTLFLALAAGCVAVQEASSQSEMNEDATASTVAESPAEVSDPAPVEEPPPQVEEPPAVAESVAPVEAPAEISAPAPVVEQPVKDEEPAAVAEPAVPVELPAEVSAPAPVVEQPLKDEESAAVAEPVAPPVAVPAEDSAPPVVNEQPPKSADPAPVAGTPEPTLDVEALKTRLRDTKAIGVFTKLALKNQMDDLLEQFRERHRRGPNANVAELRQPYNMLILKVLALVQDNDPSLARTISGSREAIWGILADREKFNSLARLKEAPLDQT